jgi:hypothetical protein
MSRRELEPRASAVVGEYSAKELASYLSADYSEPLFCLFVLAGKSAYVAHLCIFERFPDSKPESYRSKQVSYNLATQTLEPVVYIFKLLSSYCLLLVNK